MTQQQLSLFDQPTLNTCRDQKLAMSVGADRCGLSREEIVDQMNALAKRCGVNLASNGDLQMHTFEKWLNPNDLSRQSPTRALSIFCAVVRDTSALDVLARPLGAAVIGLKEQNLLKWARAYMRKRDASKTMRRIEGDLGGID